jgi:RNA polymerase sigma-70 factor (ECF subfamily)
MEDTFKCFREGDQHSFEKLYHAFFTSGRRFILTFISDRDTADEILQEVFIQIWEKREIFQNEAHFKAYFYKSLRNNTVKRLTRSKPVLEIESASGEIDSSLKRESEDLFLKITQIEFNREISRAVSLLPLKRRQIILLSMSGMSADQIAGALNITVNTVKSQKTKAYNTLREELKDIEHFIMLLLI